MSKMQAFHDRLFQVSEVYNPQMQGLSQLTQAAPTQMKALGSYLDWNDWDPKESSPASLFGGIGVDAYTLALNALSGSKVTLAQAWPEMESLFKRAASIKPRDWNLPLLACEAVGGKPEQAGGTVTAIACAQISIILIDDLLDADPRGEYQTIGASAAANL